MIEAYLLKLLLRDCILVAITAVVLGRNQQDWCIRVDHLNLVLELIEALQGVPEVNRDAKHKAVCV